MGAWRGLVRCFGWAQHKMRVGSYTMVHSSHTGIMHPGPVVLLALLPPSSVAGWTANSPPLCPALPLTFL